MAQAVRKAKSKGRKARVGPHPRDAKAVRQAFADDARHRGRREILTPEQLRRWADTGEWPESSE